MGPPFDNDFEVYEKEGPATKRLMEKMVLTVEEIKRRQP